MKRTVISILVFAFLFSVGLSAASKFQYDAQKKADAFSTERPLLILAFDITMESREEYETKIFVPDLSFKAKIKKFFTGKEQGYDKVETNTRTITMINRLKLYTESKRKMYEVQEITPSIIDTKSKRIFDGEDFFDIKRNTQYSMVKINTDFIALSVLPDWYYMHKRYMKDAIETEEPVNGKTYRFINGKILRYYLDKDTLMPVIIEFDSSDKYNKDKKIVNKVVFGPKTFKQGKHDIVNKVSIYKDDKLVKQFNVSVLRTVELLKDFVFDPEIQSKDVKQPPKKRKVTAAATEGKAETKTDEAKED
jgi:hypothetical protein